MAQPNAPAPPTRPRTVQLAVLCLFVLAGMQLVSAATGFVSYGALMDAARDYIDSSGADQAAADLAVTSTQIGLVVGVGFAALFAIGYAVLGIFTSRGSNAARITAWVVLGIGLCCSLGNLAGSAAGELFKDLGSTGGTNGVDQAELSRVVADATPGWVTAVSFTVLGISILAELAGIILLAVPASNAYFKRPAQAWEPPVPGGQYPYPGAAYPGQPGQPGQPGPPPPGSPGQPGPGQNYPPPGL